MNWHALVPLKALSEAKTRLADRLSLEERRRLSLTMLEDVAAALIRAIGVRTIAIVTPDPACVPSGCLHLADPGGGLNEALAQAARALRATRSGGLLVVPSDLPYVTPEDLESVLAAHQPGAVVLAADAAASGTNALAMALDAPTEFHFGPASLAAHLAAARGAGLSVERIDRPGLAEDIDEPVQLERLIRSGRPRYAFLQRTGFGSGGGT